MLQAEIPIYSDQANYLRDSITAIQRFLKKGAL